MKIVVISPAHPLRGGIAALSERLAQAMQEAGNEVVIYSFSLQYPSFLFPGKTQFTDEPAPDGLRIETCINSVNPWTWWTTGRRIARERPDRVVVRYWLPFMGPCLGTIVRVMNWFSKKKVHTTAVVDNIIPHEKRPGDWMFSKYFTGACTDFLVMSGSVGEEIKTFTDKPVRLAPHPIYDTYGTPMDKGMARKELGVPADVPVALFFGFIRAYKGLDILLQALPKAPGIHLIIAGEPYESWAPYQAIIDDNGLASRVHLFTDFIPSTQVRVFFSAADIVAQPYRTATQSGISQIAYHFEKPMIVSNVGGLPEIVTDGVSGYVTDPDPAPIAVALSDFFKNNREATMIKGVQQEKERFSWRYFLAKLLENA